MACWFHRWDSTRRANRCAGLAGGLRHGETQPWKHFFVVREGSVAGWGALDTVIISRRPMSPDDISRARLTAIVNRLEMVYSPGDTGGTPFAELLQARSQAISATASTSPVTTTGVLLYWFTATPEFVARLSLPPTSQRQQSRPLLFGLSA
jgi:hypothetical protein